MRELTRPDGSEAVERVHVSGTVLASAGLENQLLNCVKGDESSSERVRVPDLNCAACCG